MSIRAPEYPKPRGLLLGKRILFTAAAGTGIGFAAAKRFAEEGARIFISDLHPKRLAEAAAKISETTGTSTPSRLCDVTQEKDVRELVDAALDRLGHIDVLVNNAGLGGSAPIVQMTDEQWSKGLDVSLTSVFRMCRAVLPHMYERKSGVVINNASVLGWRAQALQAHYAAAKAGVMAFTRCAAIEAAEYGVRVNAVSPSLAMHEFLAKGTPQELLDELAKGEAFGRPAETWEVANAMLFLASDLSSYMTGEVLSVS